MTHDDMLAAFQEAEPEASSTPYSAKLSGWINRTHQQWARGWVEDPRDSRGQRGSLEPYRWNVMQKYATVATVATTETLGTSGLTDLLRVRFLYYLDGGTPLPLALVEEWQAQTMFSATGTGRPTHWFWRGESLILRPVPDDAYTLYVVYHYMPADMSGADDSPLSLRYGEGIVLGARAMLADYSNDPENWGSLKAREADAFAAAVTDDQARFIDSHPRIFPLLRRGQVSRGGIRVPSFGKGGWA
jgi:hypothetical protein